ncbi:MAG: hypothetical protein GY772_09590, partial [bacterium]|nr:hypothetical protein [bacterium]
MSPIPEASVPSPVPMEIGAAERELAHHANVHSQAKALAISMIQPVVQDAGAQVAAEHQRLAETAALEAKVQQLATQQAEERAQAAEAAAAAAKKEMEELAKRLNEARLDNEVLGRQLEERSQSSFRSAAPIPPSRGSRAASSKAPSQKPAVPKLNLAAIGTQPSPAGSVDLLDIGNASMPNSEMGTVASYHAPGPSGIAEELQTALKIARATVPPPVLAGVEPLQAVAVTRTQPPRVKQAPACSHAPAEGGGDGGDGNGPDKSEDKKGEKENGQKKQESYSKKKKKPKGDPPDDGGDGGGGGSGPPSSSSSSSSGSSSGSGDEDARTRSRLRRSLRNKKYKEAEEVKVPPLPNASQYRAWLIAVLQNLVAAAGRPDEKVIAWAREVEDDTKPPEHFATSGKRFATLDRKFGAGLSRVATGELGRKIIHMQDQAMQNENRVIKGREILRVIVRYYATGKNAEVMFSLNDLQKVTLRGDNIENFQNSWEMVLDRLPRRPDPDILLHCYHQQVKGFRPISEDIAHFNRVDDDHEDHTYEFLVNSVNRFLRRTRMEKVRDDLSKGLFHGPNADKYKQGGPPGAPGPKGKGDKEKKGKGKGKGKSRSSSVDSAKSGKGGGKGSQTCWFHANGGCKKGAECNFSHAKPSAAPAAKGKAKPKSRGKPGSTPKSTPPGTPRDKSKEPCRMHAQGRCKFGDKCHFSHKDGSRPASPKAKPKGKARPKAKPSAAAPLTPAAPAVRLAVTFASVIASVKCFDPAQPSCSGAGVST